MANPSDTLNSNTIPGTEPAPVTDITESIAAAAAGASETAGSAAAAPVSGDKPAGSDPSAASGIPAAAETTAATASADSTAETVRPAAKPKKDPADRLGPKLLLLLKLTGKWILANLRLVMPVFIIMAAALVIIGIIMISRVTEEPVEVAISEIPDNSIPIPVDAPLELNAYPELNEFFVSYYDAMAEGDREHIVSANPYLGESSLLRMEAIAEYIDHYALVDVYTKPGPVSGSYICYVYSRVKFNDYVGEVPGMNTMYVCTDESGRFFINIQNESEEIQKYINGISLLDDVKDLHNRVNVEYNEMIAADDNMTRFMDDLTQQINIKVGTQLAAASGAGIGEEPGTSTVTAPEETAPEPEPEIDPERQVEATEVVNVRAAESINSAAIGMIAPGTVYELLGELESGWSRIRFEGGEAYVKTEFLRRPTDPLPAETEDPAENAEEGTQQASAPHTGYTEQNPGRAIAMENIIVRSEPSTGSSQVTLAYPGAELTLIGDETDGWIKVKYYQYTGYVKAEYLRFENGN